ncbi:MAG: hypothetical protein R6W92_00985 [Desulfocurvibacter africanus]
MLRKKFSISLIALFITLLTAGVAFAQNGQNGQNGQGIVQSPENSLFYNIGNDHRDVGILTNRIETMVQMDDGQQTDGLQDLVDQLSIGVIAYGAAVEQTLYQSLADNQSGQTMSALDDLGLQLASNLHVALLQLYELRNTTVDSGLWLAKFKGLENFLFNHFNLETVYGFSQAMLTLDDQQLEQLGQQYETIKQQTVADIESQDLNALLEQALCAPILGEDQGFCITTDSGMNGGQTGGGQTGGGQTDDGEETTS